MATGGQNPNKEICPSGEPMNANGDRLAPWPLLPNNLELNTRSKPTKKQRNKDKSRASTSQSPSVFLDSLFPSVSDIDNPSSSKRNIKPLVNQRTTATNFQSLQSTACRVPMENETKPIKEQHANKRSDAVQARYSHLKECQAQVNSVLQQLENSDDPRVAEQILTMKGIQEDLAEKEVLLRDYAKQVYYNLEQTENKMPSYSNTPDTLGSRETNSVSVFYNEEDTSNIQNHLLEKVKASQEKLMSLQEHKSFLMNMRKKAEDSLAAFEAQIAEMNTNDMQNEQEWRFSPKQVQNSNTSAKVIMNGDYHRDKDNFSHTSSPWPSQTSLKPGVNNSQNGPENEWVEMPQDLTKLHVNLDHIKRRLELLQQISNQNSVKIEPGRNASNSIPEDLEDNLTANQRAAIEYERTKLKNTLAELQEKQKINETLKKQLLVLKDATNAIDYKEEDGSFPTMNVQDPESPDSEESAKTAADLCQIIDQLRKMLTDKSKSRASNDDDFSAIPANIVPEPQENDASSKLLPHVGPCVKRDNIHKEQHNQFPARRHYEAEGRANEDPDVPTAPPVVDSPTPDPNAWENDMRIQEKKKQLENTKKKLKMMQNLVTSIQDARTSGQQVPSELLQLLSSFKEDTPEDEGEEDEEEDEIDFDDNTITDNEDSPDNGETSVTIKKKPLESTTTRVKECVNDTPIAMPHYSENERPEVLENGLSTEAQNLEFLVLERERLIKLQEKFLELQQKFTSSSKQNNEHMRCSGEGGNHQDKKIRQAPEPPITQARRQRQDNLLTRQNVESQNRNNSAIPLKKENINDLSSKLIKPAIIQTSSDSLNKYNSGPSFSYSPDLRQKSVLEDILKHGKNKPQNYVRRDNHVHSNSSINSEPMDSSGRSFAPDTTAAATWGGSSTQENFEDDNEPGSLGDQEDDDDGNNNEAAGNISTLNRQADSSFNQYHRNEAFANYSTDSSSKRRDNRLQKYFKSTQLNQWTSKKNFAQSEALCNRNQNVPSPSEFSSEQVHENSELPNGGIASINPMPMPSKFIQQLQEQLDKLNALCRPVLHDHPQPTSEPPSSAASFQQPMNNEINASMYPTSNSCRQNEIMQLYIQQMQLQQQLLLSLSPCYHALYVQQLEIQHLSRCLQQNPESDNGSQQLPNAQPTLPEDFAFRPWFLSPWLNPGIASLAFGPGQVSPVTASPFLSSSQPPFSYASTVGSTNPPTTAPCALVTGVQPARAVVHPDRQNVETLNNQVPPRTRANNFWDNFRSQSRQNLLSSSNTSRNKDSPGQFNSPQVRQVNPVVPNESSWSHRSRVFIPPHTENNSFISHTSERPFSRPQTDTSFRLASKIKKPNWSQQTTTTITPDSTTTTNSNRFNLCPETDQVCPSNSTSSNIDQAQLSDISSFSNRAEARFIPTRSRPSAPPMNSAMEPSLDSVQAEIAKILTQNDNQSGYLMELLREVRNLKSDSLQRALNAVRELVNNENTINAESLENFESATESSEIATRENLDSKDESNPEPSFVSSLPNFGDSLPSKNSNENLCQRNNHIWPPATIIPLGKHTPKACTGAVKKRPLSEAVAPSARAWVQATPSFTENEVPQPLRSESLETTVSRIIQSILPFIQSHVTEDCCSSFRTNFCTRVIDIVKINCNFKLSSEFLLQLHSVLLHMLVRFSNLKIMECQGELIKHLGSTLYRELDIYRSLPFGSAPEEGCDSSTTILKKSAQPDLLPSSSKTICETNKQMLVTKDDRTEETEYEDVFSNSGIQEYENQIGQLFISMPSEENLLPTHINGNSLHESIRNAVSGNCSPPSSSWPTQTVNAEEDMVYECEPEAEGQPEVEAGTEADLAEADQSPGQQGSSGGGATAISNDTWHTLPQPSGITRSIATPSNNSITTSSNNVDDIVLTENACFVESANILGLSTQVSSNNSTEKEIFLDDIPTKLTPLSEEELQKQMSEEQESNSLLLEVVEDVSLARNGDFSKDPPPPYL